ncbi:MAG: hypothetical protein R3C53_13645 [Pirellulaceae bacterium]
MTSRSLVRISLATLVFALLVRSAVLFPNMSGLGDDWDSYGRLAVNWSESSVYGFEASNGSVRPTAFRPPLYPWLLSWLVEDGQVWLAGVAALHLTLGLASVWLTLSIGRKLGLAWAPLAAVAVTLDPLLMRASQLLMTETLATLLALAAWRVWLAIGLTPQASRDSKSVDECVQTSIGMACGLALGLGLLLGMAVLARPTAAPWAAGCTATLWWLGSRSWKQRLCNCAMAAVGVSICVLPWTLRNQAQLGKSIWATSHGGYTLMLANNPSLYRHFAQNGPSRDWDADYFHAAWAARDRHSASDMLDAAYWLAPPAAPLPPALQAAAADQPKILQPGEPPVEQIDVSALDHTNINVTSSVSPIAQELSDDHLAYAVAKATIARQPETFVLSIAYRIGWFWAWWPNDVSISSTIAIGGWYFLWFVAGIGGLWFHRKRRALLVGFLPALILILTLTVIHSVYWSNMRMRAPLMPIVYLLAICPLAGRTAVARN